MSPGKFYIYIRDIDVYVVNTSMSMYCPIRLIFQDIFNGRFYMKKVIIASIVALGMSNAYAANGEVQFIGAVTATTCDLTPEVNGSVNNMIQLGTASTNSTAPAVNFTLKADVSQSGCTSLTDTDVASISWGGPFNTQGLENQSGSAAGSWVQLTAVNSKTTNEIMTASKTIADFAGDTINTDGAQFKAVLNGGSAAGDFKSAAAFVVAYK